jgi:hypothetical protein
VLKKSTFFVAEAAAIFAESPKITVEGAAGPTSGRVAPFKKFSKKRKKGLSALSNPGNPHRQT